MKLVGETSETDRNIYLVYSTTPDSAFAVQKTFFMPIRLVEGGD